MYIIKYPSKRTYKDAFWEEDSSSKPKIKGKHKNKYAIII